MLKFYLKSLSCLLLLSGCDAAGPTEHIDAITVVATGDNYSWHFQYPGQDGVLGTEDDQYSRQDLLLPAGAEVTLKLNSNDYLYSFALPAIGLKEIAVPGLDFELNFQSGPTRVMDLLGDQFCGFSHDSLNGRVSILDQRYGFYEQLETSAAEELTQTDLTVRPKTL